MIRYFWIELQKIRYTKIIPVLLLVLSVLCFVVSEIEMYYMNFEQMVSVSPAADYASQSEVFYRVFMCYNATFCVPNMLIPLLSILMAASVWGGEYTEGMLKVYLIGGVKKRDLFCGKTASLLLLTFVMSVVVFFLFSAVAVVWQGRWDVPLHTYISIMKVYGVSFIGMLPILFFTIAATIYLGEFQKGFLCGALGLVLSLSAGGMTDYTYVLPTAFLSRCTEVCGEGIPVFAFFVWAVYTAGLLGASAVLFRRKDIWY